MDRNRSKTLSVLLSVFLLGPATAAWPQVTTSTLYGIIRDPSGAVIPGVGVTITHEGTGAAKQTVTGDTGEFVFTDLLVGSYTLKIEMPGFKSYVSHGIALAAGQKIRQTFDLQVGEIAEAVTVQGGASPVNTVSPEQRETIGRLQVAELPLSRRNITSVLRLSTGVDISGHTRSVRINGVGKHGTGITVDGTDANSNPEGRGLSQYQGVNYVDVMSIEAVQEVEVVRGILPAEYGSVVGGQVNLISRSGTNAWHGSLFENYQSHIFNARHPFVPSRSKDGTEIPKPRQVFNQFGGSVGGPILRDKAFIFGAYEGYRESSFQALGGQTPTQKFRDEILKALSFPETKIVLDTLPLPTSLRNDDIGFFLGAGNQTAHENHAVVKGDLRLTQDSSLSLTYTRNRPFLQIPSFYVNSSNDRFWVMKQDRLTANYTLSGPHWTSESRVGINRMRYLRQDAFLNVKDPKNPGEKNPMGRRVPLISVSGLFGTPRGEVWDMEGPTYSFDQKIARHSGQHLFKLGGKYVMYGGSRNKLANPIFAYRSKAELLANIPLYVEPTLGSPPYKSRMHELGFFAQDDWRVNSKLVLNLGLRYDFYSHVNVKPSTDIPVGVFNLSPPSDWHKFDFGPPRDPKKPYANDGWVNLGPRLGFAYNPDGHGKMVVRGGFGVLFSPQMPAVVRQGVAHPVVPFRVRWNTKEAAALGLKWPFYNDQLVKSVEAEAARSGKTFVFSVFNPNLQNPYTMHYQLNIQRELTPTLVLETGYVGNRGVKFILHRFFNQTDRETGLRPNPIIGAPGGYYVDNSQNTVYSAWQTSLRKRFSHNLSFDAHYTWGKGLAVTGGDIGAYYQGDVEANIQNFFNPKGSRGPAVGDVTHRFTADWIYDLPRLSNTNAWVRHAVGGWQVSGVFIARSGEPITVFQPSSEDVPSRPDYVGGNTVVANWSRAEITQGCGPGVHCGLQYLNVSAFVAVPVSAASRLPIRPGTAGVGLVRSPGSWTVDFSLAKNFKVREQVAFQFRADMFNALNHVNFGGPDTNVNSPFFGQIFGIATSMRVMQLAGRLTF